MARSETRLAGGGPVEGPAEAPAALDLDRFVPYRVSVLANRLSGALARQYADRFDLTIPEWRVMAVLGREGEMTANALGARTVMGKVTVSRAVARLSRMGRLDRRVDAADRRRALLRLSAEGLAVYQAIVPLALAYERRVLAALAPRDRAAFERLLSVLDRHLGGAER